MCSGDHTTYLRNIAGYNQMEENNNAETKLPEHDVTTAPKKPDKKTMRDTKRLKQQAAQTLSSDQISAAKSTPATNAEKSTITFYIAGRTGPVVFQNERKIVLGREDRGIGIYPTLDLTEDDGAALGVSRHHAEILLVEDNYYIKDLDSTNGTWINTKEIQPDRYYPIKSGDTLHLGKLAIFIV